jgi:hypothetical protein
MLHLQSVPETQTAPEPYAEAVARLAGIRHALRLVDPCGGGPAPDNDDEQAIASAWAQAPDSKQRRFDVRSAQLVGATAAGLEALLDQRQKGREPNQEASRALVDQIRRELAQVSRLILA